MTATIKHKASYIARTIKASLAMLIPILFIGSITVLLNGFPVMAYQNFLDSFLGGALRSVIMSAQYGTVGILAVYITVALSFSYANQAGEGLGVVYRFGSLLGCLSGFFILVGFFAGEPDLSLLSGQGVFSALIAGMVGSALFRKFETMFKTTRMVFVDGADSEFNTALHVIQPFLCVTACFAFANYLITVCFGVQSMQHLFMNAVDTLFFKMQRSYTSGLLFTTLTSVMWWFGIHGNNVLNQVAEDMFSAIIPGQIVSKSFIDTFVNMGGTGCVIGLLLAIPIFGKRSSTKRLFGMAFLPGLFNIGELLVFGFPIIYNPVMLLPFILSPILCFSNAYLMTKVGFLPPVTHAVIWTTPPLMSGYLATDSIRGILVQLMNILLSIACYAPFVILYEKKSLEEYSLHMDPLLSIFKKGEETGEKATLTECEGNVGRLAKILALDLEAALAASSPGEGVESSENPLSADYRMHKGDDGRYIGAEAHLKWEHRRYGPVDPPLLLQIAKESGDLYLLETNIIERALKDAEEFRRKYGPQFVMDVFVTASTLYDRRFVPYLQNMADVYRLRTGYIRIKIADPYNLEDPEKTDLLFARIRTYGFVIAEE